MEQWYLACHKAGTDNVYKAQSALTHLDGAVFCPLIRVRRPRADRPGHYRQMIEPLFPGYLFILFDPDIHHTSKIESYPGISYLVRTAGQITAIQDAVVEKIMRLPMCPTEADVLARVRSEKRIIHADKYRDMIEDIAQVMDETERTSMFLAWMASLNKQKKPAAHSRRVPRTFPGWR